MIFYYKQSGQVSFYSDLKCKHDSFSELVYNPSKKELEKIKQGFAMEVVNGKLILSKTNNILKIEKDEEIQTMKDKINQDKAKGETNIDDVIALLNKIII